MGARGPVHGLQRLYTPLSSLSQATAMTAWGWVSMTPLPGDHPGRRRRWCNKRGRLLENPPDGAVLALTAAAVQSLFGHAPGATFAGRRQRPVAYAVRRYARQDVGAMAPWAAPLARISHQTCLQCPILPLGPLAPACQFCSGGGCPRPGRRLLSIGANAPLRCAAVPPFGQLERPRRVPVARQPSNCVSAC